MTELASVLGRGDQKAVMAYRFSFPVPIAHGQNYCRASHLIHFHDQAIDWIVDPQHRTSLVHFTHSIS